MLIDKADCKTDGSLSVFEKKPPLPNVKKVTENSTPPPPPPAIPVPPPPPVAAPPVAPPFGAPPPPPPVGAKALGRPAEAPPEGKKPKKQIDLGHKLKACHWPKLKNKDIGKTIFLHLDDEDVKIDERTIIEHFAIAQKKKVVDDSVSHEKTSVLCHARAHAVELCYANLDYSILESIDRLDEDTINVTMIGQIIKCIPTTEEKALLEAEEELREAEHFMLSLSRMPYILNRLEAWRYSMIFHEDASSFDDKITCLRTALIDIRKSENFAAVLQVILKIGNVLNGRSAKKGMAYGFKLSFINKLDGTKCNDGKMNLLMYIVEVARENNIGDFISEFSIVPRARRVDAGSLGKDIRAHRTKMRDLGRLLKEVDTSTTFYTKLSSFHREKSDIIDDIFDNFSSIEDQIAETILYFGEDPKKMNCEELFALIDEFCGRWKKACRMLEDEYIRRQKEEEKMQRMQDEGYTSSGDEDERYNCDEIFQAMLEQDAEVLIEELKKKRQETKDRRGDRLARRKASRMNRAKV